MLQSWTESLETFVDDYLPLVAFYGILVITFAVLAYQWGIEERARNVTIERFAILILIISIMRIMLVIFNIASILKDISSILNQSIIQTTEVDQNLNSQTKLLIDCVLNLRDQMKILLDMILTLSSE